jgi:hypothetical protein
MMFLLYPIMEGLRKIMADNPGQAGGEGTVDIEATDHIEIAEDGMNEEIDIEITATGLSEPEAEALHQELKGAGDAGAGHAQMGADQPQAGDDQRCPTCR